jgi:Protein of unknown function (DUF2586)
MNELTITVGEGGLGRQTPNEDNIRGLVMNAGAVAPTGLALNTPKLLLSPKDATDIGIDKAYDTAQTVLCYYHIKEFFAENPNGKLWIYLVAQATTLTQMSDGTAGTPCHVLKLALATNGEIKQYSTARNPAIGYTPTITTGADGDVWTAIPKAQVLMDYLFANHMPSDIIIEGRSFSGSAGAIANLRALACANVRVVFAQDLDVAPSTANAVIKGHAAVGTFLGTSSKAKVSDSIAWVERYNVSSVANGRWLNVGFSSNTNINTFTNIDLNTLDSKGCIFIRKFVGDTGAYWNEAHSCTLITSDYAYMNGVLTINKAVRGVYKALLPKLNSPVKVNDDGQLSTEVIASFESAGLRPLDNMQINDEVSAKDIYINPLQNINTTSKLNVKIKIVPIGTARNIEVEIGYAVSI